MIVCLDANIVIYYVERDPIWEPKVTTRFKSFAAAGDCLAVSEAAILECLVGPLQSGDAAVLADYLTFFALPFVRKLQVHAGVWERAARIRAAHGFRPLDATHLACAKEHGCGRFLSNDVP